MNDKQTTRALKMKACKLCKAEGEKTSRCGACNKLGCAKCVCRSGRLKKCGRCRYMSNKRDLETGRIYLGD